MKIQLTLTLARATGMATAALGLSLAAALTWAAPADQQQIKQGEYLARVGDCIACHSAVGGKPFAGGLALGTPIGKVYSTNITPDPKNGIGEWSFDDFDKLMRTGVTKAGYTVYPAMPYPSYSRLSAADMQALYAYFMHGVTPETTPNKAADIPWPLSMRFPLTFWRWAFAPTPQPHVPPAGSETAVLRGAYLVEGLGHCGACHTARAVTMQETALTGLGHSDYLAGGAAIDGWSAPSLRNEHGGGLARWSEGDIVDFLKTGRNSHTASFGPMNDVVRHSMQYLTDTDLASVATYLKSLPASNNAAAFVADPKVGQALFLGKADTSGAMLYLNKCAGCHRSDGAGNGKAFPALAGNALLQNADATSTINIILSGGAVPSTHTAPSSLTMAPYADQLNDEQVAQVVNFVRTSWGNRGSTTTAEQVAKIRKIAVPVKGAGEAAFAAGRPDAMPVKRPALQ
ncbi:cytochrome c [Herbaspirillum sp. RTI4]|uniref:cytochrome c n=1 Tax=Herbaspirillum sp. RTI4 TaxID=3048640 RepID=UPI002AB341D2|nr:cytochrome c [Herbaspirillum sp. RTI4]MDY7579853.1 cytochrome c [Herbaspirillum sp. RTI4]MEA9981940.1 cytochrome c [Herbaspirillum sp. RTI4]